MLEEWAREWAIPDAALVDLRARLGAVDAAVPIVSGGSEAAVQSECRLQASRLGLRVWRNNVGAGYAEDGSFMRWGLANDSAQVNKVLKSADLIGIRPVKIGLEHMGQTIGRFVSIECKHAGWKWSGNEREIAQRNWALLVNSLGGEAKFVNDARQV